ncbi:MAG: hypothetical protein ROZ09_03915 [Thiobacillus sp.]|jgi:hypothetical protein|uniref:hypothetical protein n=1 Tax=Thiobacillus sp. TaxID=924 RepID=UPI002893E6A7|nr:hypothetical protein [Thiobacillus sp.]MDT3705950.1 hypothetical protein [Thiobacillus sp.]
MKRPHGSHRLAGAGALLAALIAPAAWADSTSAAFNVSITLNDSLPASQQVSISEALSARPNTVVQVVCSSDQFVRIDPDPAKPFLGVRDTAFLYQFWPRYEIGPPDSLGGGELRYAGACMVMAARVYNPGNRILLLALLVSF